MPKARRSASVLGEVVAQDGTILLTAIYAADVPPWLRNLPAVELLRQVWMQNFYQEEDVTRWCRAQNIPPAAKAICSPFDAEACYSIKPQTEWTGYKVHLTETCDADTHSLITHVITTPATEQDNEIVSELHQALTAKEMLPQEHLLDRDTVIAIPCSRHGMTSASRCSCRFAQITVGRHKRLMATICLISIQYLRQK